VFAKNEFLKATHTDRLALMRNLKMRYSSGQELLERIFDRDDTQLNITLTEREDLILAFLTNSEALKHIEEQAGLTENPDGISRYRFDSDSANSFLNHLWELAAKWPTDKLPAPVPQLTYRHVPAKDETRAKIYQSCNVPIVRRAILESSSERDIETLRLGVRDEDTECRHSARSGIHRFNLYSQIDIYPEQEPESQHSKQKSLVDRFRHWWQRD
jgi:hypothetical protein